MGIKTKRFLVDRLAICDNLIKKSYFIKLIKKLNFEDNYCKYAIISRLLSGSDDRIHDYLIINNSLSSFQIEIVSWNTGKPNSGALHSKESRKKFAVYT